MRLTMIFVGARSLTAFTGFIHFRRIPDLHRIKMFRHEEIEVQPEKNIAVRASTRFLPITRHYEGKSSYPAKRAKLSGTLCCSCW
jgi:hypothetical protein